MTDRKRFEAWRRQRLESLGLAIEGEFDKYSDGEYQYGEVRLAWEAWQASRKQALVEAIAICEGGEDFSAEDPALSFCLHDLRRLARSDPEGA